MTGLVEDFHGELTIKCAAGTRYIRVIKEIEDLTVSKL